MWRTGTTSTRRRTCCGSRCGIGTSIRTGTCAPVSLSPATADHARPAEGAEPAGAVHQATLERVIGRIFGAVALAIVLQFWVSSRADGRLAAGQPGREPASERAAGR